MKPTNLIRNPIYCPRCGSLIGFQFENVEMPKIKKVRFTIGDKKYPAVDLDKAGKIPLFCHFCGYKFKPKREG